MRERSSSLSNPLRHRNRPISRRICCLIFPERAGHHAAGRDPGGIRHPLTYFKSALDLVLLREQILGPERSDWAFRKYIGDWSFKHPSPSDFFRAMESSGGEDLSWFWRGWYLNNWTLGMAVEKVRPAEGGWSKGAIITVANLDRIVMPAVLDVTFKSSAHQHVQLPAEIWIQKTEAQILLNSNKPVVSITLDPDHVIPDKDRHNNVLRVTG